YSKPPSERKKPFLPWTWTMAPIMMTMRDAAEKRDKKPKISPRPPKTRRSRRGCRSAPSSPQWRPCPVHRKRRTASARRGDKDDAHGDARDEKANVNGGAVRRLRSSCIHAAPHLTVWGKSSADLGAAILVVYLLPDGRRDLPIARINRFSVRIHHRPQLNAREPGGELGEELQRLVQVSGLDDREAAQDFLGLGEWSV